MIVTGCTCDIFDIGYRCEACVAACAAAGHPYTEQKYNGQHHWCGKPSGNRTPPAATCPSGCGRNEPCPDPWHDRRVVTPPGVES